MSRRRHSVDQIIGKPPQADVELGQGETVEEACRALEITVQTYDRWRQKYGGMQPAMTEILIAALTTGLANVVTYTIDELSTPIKGLPGNERDHIFIHELGHNGG